MEGRKRGKCVSCVLAHSRRTGPCVVVGREVGIYGEPVRMGTCKETRTLCCWKSLAEVWA